jgi:hypothetical protein
VDAKGQNTWSEQFFEAVRILRVAWLIPALTFLTLALPPQVHDLYRTLVEIKNESQYWLQIAITVLLLLLAAYLTYRVGRHRVLVHAHTVSNRGSVLEACLRWGPPLCGALVLVAAAIGIFLSVAEVPDSKGIDVEIDKILDRMAGTRRQLVIAASALAIFSVLFLLRPLVDRWWPRSTGEPSAFAFTPVQQIVCLATAVVMIGVAFFPQVSIPLSQGLGSLAIFLLFLCVLLVVLSLLQSWSDRKGVPLIFFLLLWVLALAIFDRGDAHRIRLIDTPSKGSGLIQVQWALLDWYRARKDKDAYQSEPYPVYLIAAEGGGLYAAQFTAKVLARLQDICPNFAQHVFAISSVSGGSLGAAVFSSLAKKHAANGPWQPCRIGSNDFEQKVNAILDRDFLAPIVARTFFADVLQLFLPSRLSVLQFNRGRALEETIEYAWAKAEGSKDNPFAAPFLSHWQAGAGDAAPALLLNTTSVNDGRLVVITPIGSDANMGDDTGQLHLMPAFPTNKDLTLSGAVGLSGRFPWILPAATVGDDGPALVDGAYFEGSGVEALMSVVRNALRRFEVKPTGASEFPYIDVHILVIGSAQPRVDALQTLDEVTPPLRTMLKARERRGYIAFNSMRDANRTIDCPPVRPEALIAAAIQDRQTTIQCSSPPPQTARLNYDYFNLPLGWQLSSGMRDIIEQHSRGRCVERTAASPGAPNPDENFTKAQDYLRQNYNLPVEIAAHLSAGRAAADGGIKACY